MAAQSAEESLHSHTRLPQTLEDGERSRKMQKGCLPVAAACKQNAGTCSLMTDAEGTSAGIAGAKGDDICSIVDKLDLDAVGSSQHSDVLHTMHVQHTHNASLALMAP